MKKFILSLFAVALLGGSAFAQEQDKYTRTMMTRVAELDTTHSAANMLALSAAFERIAEAEKTKWLPYYYAAVTQVKAAQYMSQNGSISAEVADPMADKATAFIAKADGLNPNNSEVYVVKKMIATLRMMADPMNRYMQYGPIAEEALQSAMKLNPDNPRVYLLQGQDKYFTPEQFGGSKAEAQKLFEMAIKKFDTTKPASAIDPSWGRSETEYFMKLGGK